MIRPLRDLIGALLITCLTIVTVEATLSVSGVEAPPPTFRPDATRCIAFRRGLEGWFRSEGNNYARLNSSGYHDIERATSRPSGTVRIAVLGDSTVAALQVPTSQTFCARIEQTLSKQEESSGRKVEVLNFGVNNYSPAQQYLTLRDEVWKYSPQIVIATVSPANGVFNSTRDLSISETDFPFYEYRGGELVPDETTRRYWSKDPSEIERVSPLMDFVGRLKIWALIASARSRVNYWEAVASRRLLHHIPSDYVKSWPYQPPRNPVMENGWRVSEGMFIKMREEAEKHGAEFWLVVLDLPEQVNPDPSLIKAACNRYGVPDLDYADDRMAKFGARENIRTVLMAPPMREIATRENVNLHGFSNTLPNAGHLNAIGHEAAARIISQALTNGSTVLKAAPEQGRGMRAAM